ncbi:hypothetical protein, unlikely [Trypanosoma brucei gambiense DAL972]|uniref:Uncharacterized protein n=1 Tax=Trypanosoma brucei gambiense (strain MHOM/CI/86/DAL972) TaxID=679716 RepID=C9ZN19_TRYB9|nr:hypothetical protein, unlikely [Trypanosoma brucei gambiense DAL972]CBH10673.1 hypothetical protein, unlikely [Trypanosoma brucei gambiense DAL972]|eukprot:XP_011772961.1 hypothetical protein, unlikely [Trypanosoma brucei gambiense DAL972]
MSPSKRKRSLPFPPKFVETVPHHTPVCESQLPLISSPQQELSLHAHGNMQERARDNKDIGSRIREPISFPLLPLPQQPTAGELPCLPDDRVRTVIWPPL